MEKLTYLYDLEFKKNKKIYFGFSLFMSLILMIILVRGLNDYNKAIELGIESIGKIEVNELLGNTSFSSIIKDEVNLIYIIGLTVCVSYSFVIWTNDIKNKSIYTLMMIPGGRIKVYISKLLNVISFVYIYIISFVGTIFISYNIFPMLIKDELYHSINFYNDIARIVYNLPIDLYTFFIGYVLLLTALICIIFNFVLHQSNSNISKLKKVIINICGFIIFMNMAMYIMISSTIIPYKFTIGILSIIITVICLIQSNYILNKKMEF